MDELRNLDILEHVLDVAFRATTKRVIHFSVRELHDFAGSRADVERSPQWWSRTLSEYRTTKTHRYRIVAEGYGPAARWRAIAKHHVPALHRLRQSQEHHLYVVQDAIKREAKDLNTEVLPALQINEAGAADIAYRINEYEVTAVQRLVSAGMSRADALVWIEPLSSDLRGRWAA
jgi:hypothetical protein